MAFVSLVAGSVESTVEPCNFTPLLGWPASTLIGFEMRSSPSALHLVQLHCSSAHHDYTGHNIERPRGRLNDSKSAKSHNV